MKNLAASNRVTALAGLAALVATNALAVTAKGVPQAASYISAAERIEDGEINCPRCDLSGADLSNQCVKGGDLTGANLAQASARFMCMNEANFTGASFRNADLTGANLDHSNLTRADLTGAKLNIANIAGADMSTAKGLTQAQIDRACGDAETKLPRGLRAKPCS